MMNANHIKARRIDFLQSKLEELASRKQRLTTLISSGCLPPKAHGLSAKRLEWVTEDIRKRAAALADLSDTKKR
ncbi:hypothetical protein [Occallatibacter savannae]|uniref:hypothetical protein n=1 Tax=Occallatibacter savannae TaxID=1002691 RepID=UPI000D69B881|nr:hypothetical protein [Occallatibacter savannae]